MKKKSEKVPMSQRSEHEREHPAHNYMSDPETIKKRWKEHDEYYKRHKKKK